MFDVSDRFLHQLAADRRASLQRSGRASAKRKLRPALGAALARLGLAAGGCLGGTPSLHRTPGGLDSGDAGTAEASATNGVLPPSQLRPGAEQS